MGFIFDLIDPLVWFIVRYYLKKRGYRLVKAGKCYYFGDDKFCSLANDALNKLKEDSPSEYEQLLETHLGLIQDFEEGSYKRTLRSRFNVPKWLIDRGSKGIESMFVLSLFMHQEYREMGFFRKYFLRPVPAKSVEKLLHWLSNNWNDESVYKHYSNYLKKNIPANSRADAGY